ncbi:MAG TPA: hypothetical protein PLH57_07490, partial [Oligoflexia bacterium]|nr:hypothetical protein [Oligoflexia bacterium]
TASQAATPSPLKVREDVFKKSIRLSPAAHILKLQWNVHRSVAPKRIKTYLAVVRNQVCVETLELQPQEHRLLESIKNPVSTESFLNFVAKQTTATKLKKWITRWSQNNLIQFE